MNRRHICQRIGSIVDIETSMFEKYAFSIKAYVAAVYSEVNLLSKGLFRLSPTALSAAVSVCLTTPTL